MAEQEEFNALDRLRPRVPKRTTSLVSMAVTPPNPTPTPAIEDPASEPAKLSQATIRIDSELMGQLAQWKFKDDISNDTFLEAAIALASEDPDLLNKLVADAKKRTAQRRIIREGKRINTLIKRYKDK